MKRKLVLLLFVIVWIAAGVSFAKAQVKIGGNADDPITPGAVLDLSSTTDGGLLLPQVTLTVATALPNEWIGTVAHTDLLESGLMVYNLGGAGLVAGVYIWQGTNGWVLVNAGGGSGPVPESITISASPSGAVQVDAAQTLTATVLPVNAGWTTVNWGGNDPSVALVDKIEGSVNTATITGIHSGTTTVTASLDGVSSDPFTVNVVACGMPFTAPLSGKVYNTAAYNNANLTNLCWTTTSLQEAGESATCFANNCTAYPPRGYYYTAGVAADNACAALNSGGTTWRVPTGIEWAALRTALPSLAAGVGTTGTITTLQADWNSANVVAGGYVISTKNWHDWGVYGDYWAQGADGLHYGFRAGTTTVNNWTTTDRWFPVRCVRSL